MLNLSVLGLERKATGVINKQCIKFPNESDRKKMAKSVSVEHCKTKPFLSSNCFVVDKAEFYVNI